MRRLSAVAWSADVAEGLRRAAERAAQKARALRRPVLAWSATRLAPLDPLDVFARSRGRERLLWARPDEGFGLLGIGSVWASSPDGPGRFEQAAADWRACLDDAVGDDATAGGPPPGPLALGGFAFSSDGLAAAEWTGFPSAVIALPALTLTVARDGCWLTLAARVDPDTPVRLDDVLAYMPAIAEGTASGTSDASTHARGGPFVEEVPSAEVWKEAVERAARAVRDGLLRKVVLARAINVRGVDVRPAAALRTLRVGYPGCAVFAITRGDRCFLGATPERLVRIRGGQVNTAAIAGSAPRGRTPEEDDRLGAALQRNPKDRLEHAVVVDVVRETLLETCADLTVTAPTVLKIANIQHLKTVLTGHLRERLSVLELAGRLHPTPAVGGFPRDRALRWLHEHEGLDRGWYAGPVGWIDRQGEGEFAVAIRSGLIWGDEARVFAGCGIVAESDPDHEYAESWLKLRPMMAALGFEEIEQARHAGRRPEVSP